MAKTGFLIFVMLDWCMLVLYNRVNSAPHSRSKHVSFEICQVLFFEDKTSIFVFNSFNKKRKSGTGLVLKILLKTKKLYFTQVDDDLSEKTSLATFAIKSRNFENLLIFDFLLRPKLFFFPILCSQNKNRKQFYLGAAVRNKKMCFTQFEGDLSESCQFDLTEVVRISHLY